MCILKIAISYFPAATTLFLLFLCVFAGDENDAVHFELEKERDGPLAGNMRH